MQKLTDSENDALREAQADLVRTAMRRGWRCKFDDRQKRLIKNCRDYASGDPAGMPGHNLALIIAKMADLLDEK